MSKRLDFYVGRDFTGDPQIIKSVKPGEVNEIKNGIQTLILRYPEGVDKIHAGINGMIHYCGAVRREAQVLFYGTPFGKFNFDRNYIDTSCTLTPEAEPDRFGGTESSNYRELSEILENANIIVFITQIGQNPEIFTQLFSQITDYIAKFKTAVDLKYDRRQNIVSLPITEH